MKTSYYKTAEDFDWYKHYPATFATTTAHLSHVELGVYRRILDHYWTSDNKLPRDTAQIAERIGEKVFNWRRYGIIAPAGFDNEEVTIKVVEHLINEFFEQDEDANWHHVWLDDYRNAADVEFKERSRLSKERSARQPRVAGGKFGKVVTVADGEVTPCSTAEPTEPDGEVTVEQSREEQRRSEKSKSEESKVEENKVEQSKVLDVATSLPKEPPVTLVKNPPLTPEQQANRDRLHTIPQKSPEYESC